FRGLVAQILGGVGERNNSRLRFEVSQGIFSLIKPRADLVGLLRNKIKRPGRPMDFQVLVEISVYKFAQNQVRKLAVRGSIGSENNVASLMSAQSQSVGDDACCHLFAWGAGRVGQESPDANRFRSLHGQVPAAENLNF